jgi:hypothetical protein
MQVKTFNYKKSLFSAYRLHD